MPTRHALIQILADGRFHSGEKLGSRLNISRTAVWKLVQKLVELGLEIDAVKGRGYRLSQAVELMNSERILHQLTPATNKLLSGLEINFEVDSTNSYLIRKADQLPSRYASFAEIQHSGRGRRGRQWVSPFGSNLYHSILWRFDEGSAALTGLSLAVAVAVARMLESLGVSDLSVKWPNDLLYQGKKLAGILIEVAGESDGPCYVVVGVGLNISMPESSGISIDQPWSDLNSAGIGAGRNQIAGSLLNELLLALTQFQQAGLTAFLSEWQRLDATYDQRIALHSLNSTVTGIGKGIDGQGMLLLENSEGISRHASGEVSLRFQS
jgi:BirA family biotin operon repressor/biotin-[acetyl-CoA-carboxylase] ligase